MAFVKSYDIKCDGEDCTKWSDPSFTKEEAAEWAEQQGWLILTQKHYCPQCRKTKKGKKDNNGSRICEVT